MTAPDVIPVMLVLLFSFVTLAGVSMFWLVVWWKRRDGLNSTSARKAVAPGNSLNLPDHSFRYPRRPEAWLAIHKRTLAEVQAALSLDGVRPAVWEEDADDDRTLFIMPPINGWTFVFGKGLPNPADDVDTCFRFLTCLSRQLGQVQFFCADATLSHHAWARLQSGKVLRAYAWADGTVWNQGERTPAEKELDLKCFDYTDGVSKSKWGLTDLLLSNVEKVSSLAARWSLDPAEIDDRTFAQAHGIAGRPSRRY
jgi:hypothetical protein